MKKLLTVLIALTTVACGKHGSDGKDGETKIVNEYVRAPVNPHGIKEIIPICGVVATGAEVVIKLNNGDLLVSFSNNNHGDFTRIGYILEGIYRTTDQFQCSFEVYLDDQGKKQIRRL